MANRAYNTVFKSVEHIMQAFLRQLGLDVWQRKQAARTARANRKRHLAELRETSKRMRTGMR